MGGRSGINKGLLRKDRAGNKNGLSEAGHRLLDLIHSGQFDALPGWEKDELIGYADINADTLIESPRMYEKAGLDRAINAYQGSGYRYMNKVARGYKTGTGDKEFDAKVKQWVKDLDKAISMRKLEKDVIVWRGSDVEESRSGRFVSVSLKAKVSNGFRVGKHMHAYKIPKGTNYLYSNSMSEHELILPRGFDLNKYRIK